MKLINSTKRYSVIDVNPEDLADQLTLIDLPIFKSIQRDELLNSTSDTSSARTANLCPNIVAMRRQFNQVTFWVVGQVLAHDSPRLRAECISNLIKTSKCLYQLNNLHSSNAVVSALLSTPIYRLERTWHYVNKKYPKDKNQFDKLRELYSDINNYDALRKHLASCDLPCIPYLGLYSRDIIYINEAHQEGTMQRATSISKILKSIEKFQESEYKNLVRLPEIQSCLLASRYIDELQKFVEDENYRRSLEFEPADNDFACSLNNNNNNSLLAFDNNNQLNLPKQLNHSSSSTSIIAHQKPRSNNVLAGLTSMVHSAVQLSTSYKFGHHNQQQCATTTNSSSATSNLGSPRPLRYLIDDSLLDDVPA